VSDQAEYERILDNLLAENERLKRDMDDLVLDRIAPLEQKLAEANKLIAAADPLAWWVAGGWNIPTVEWKERQKELDAIIAAVKASKDGTL